MGGGGSGSSQVTEWNPPEYAQPYLESILPQAAQLASQPYVAYGGPTVAGLNDRQTSAMENISNMAMTSDPGVNASSNMLLNTLSGSYQNPAATVQTQIAPNDYLGMGAQAYTNPYVGQSTQGYVNPYVGQTTQAASNPYNAMDNPYLAGAIQSGQQRLVDQYLRSTVPQNNAMAALGHNFGGSAHQQVMDASQENLLNALSGVETQYGLPAYQQAASQAQNMAQFNAGLQQGDIGRNLSGQMAQNQYISGLQAADIARNLQGMQGYNQYVTGNEQQNIARNAELAQAGINLGTQTQLADLNRMGSAWDAERVRQMQAAPQALNNFNNQMNANQAMLQMGNLEQAQTQALYDENRNAWSAEQASPYQQLDNYINWVARASGLAGTNSVTAQNSGNNWASGVGGVLGLLGLAGLGGS